VARVDKVVGNQSGAGFIDSGVLDYSLKAGKRYLLGVVVSGGEAVSYYDSAPWTALTSFGASIGYVHSGYSAQLGAESLYADRLYQMRLTTSVP
jgi:hypothetical protein